MPCVPPPVSIGGVPPVTPPTCAFIDPDLLQYDEVQAAAGTWHDVRHRTAPAVEASDGEVADSLPDGVIAAEVADGHVHRKRRRRSPMIVRERAALTCSARRIPRRQPTCCGDVTSRKNQWCNGRLAKVPTTKAVDGELRSVGADGPGDDRLMSQHAEHST